MGTHNGIDARYSPLKTDNNNSNESLWRVDGHSSFGRTLKGMLALVLLILIFIYTTWSFAGSNTTTSDDNMQSRRLDVESFRQTEIIIDTRGHEREQNTSNENPTQSVPMSNGKAQQHNVEPLGDQVIQVTGPEKDDTRPGNIDKSDGTGKQEDNEIRTVFSTLHSSFADLNIGENNQIPTLQFINVGMDLKPLLDAIGSSVSLIEGDMTGNAKKLLKVYKENPSECETLQDMLTFDLKRGRTNDNERSVVSLMWYKRAYEFIGRFMKYTINGAEPSVAAGTAYDEVLSKHHGMFVGAAFRLGMKMLPSRQNFIKQLIINKEDLHRPNYEAKVMADTEHFLNSMGHVFTILKDFYTEHHLEN